MAKRVECRARPASPKRVDMSSFTATEIAYLQTQRLGRLGTVGPNAEPHVAPVPFRYNPDHDTIDVGGQDFTKRKKYHDVQRNPQVAIVVDDLASVSPVDRTRDRDPGAS